MDWIYYFAYSLHLDAESLERLCIPVEEEAHGILSNYRLVFNVLEDEYFRFERRGLANIVPSAGGLVEGMIYRLRECDLPRLDEDAGVLSLKYYRKLIRVRCHRGLNYTAHAYAAWPDKTSGGLLPRQDYLKQLIAAARRHGFSPSFRHWLESHPAVR
ncbi:MAG TPA: gamma-glutamylcyclotransferase [bacterium]|nr:gamma-glutamylcyclotransferase [Candidatus Omnitrophota bacterium]HOJ59092.1 gamma-glutamylcyclotransferase [bacterium]HOL93268.1 gamma-glutamylcyclotransferase [bacterium]HPP02432.1 gamma-glutamylcyclotransferase [bacterium]